MLAVFIGDQLTLEDVDIRDAGYPVMYRTASGASPIMLGSRQVQRPYFSRPAMFDGRPVYAIDTVDVQEVVLADFFKPPVDESAADERNRENVWLFIEKNTSEAQQLDEWTGFLPWTADELQQGLDRQGLQKRGIKVLVMRQRPDEIRH